MQMSKWKNEEDEKESNEQRETKTFQDMLSTGVGVLLVSKVEVLVDNIELNCWKKMREKEQLRS